MTMKRHFIAALGSLVLSTGAAQATDVNFASFQPPKSAAVTHGLEPFAERVGTATDGELDFSVFSGGALLGARNTVEGLRSGIAQMGQIVFGYHPAEFPSSVMIADMAMYGDYPPAVAAAVTEYVLLHCDSCQKEYAAEGIVVLGLTSTPPYVLIGNTDLSDLSNLSGLKVRTPGALWDRWATHFGATSVNMPSSDMYEGLSRGALDVVLQPVGSLKSHSFWDIAKDVTVTNLGTYRAWGIFAAGAGFWSELSDDQKELMISEAAYGVIQASLGYMELDTQALAEAESHEVRVHEPTEAHKAAMAEFIEADRANILSKARDQLGLADAEERLEIFTGLIAKWDENFAPIQGDLDAMATMLQEAIAPEIESLIAIAN